MNRRFFLTGLIAAPIVAGSPLARFIMPARPRIVPLYDGLIEPYDGLIEPYRLDVLYGFCDVILRGHARGSISRNIAIHFGHSAKSRAPPPVVTSRAFASKPSTSASHPSQITRIRG